MRNACVSMYSVRMQEIPDQKNSEYGHYSRVVFLEIPLTSSGNESDYAEHNYGTIVDLDGKNIVELVDLREKMLLNSK